MVWQETHVFMEGWQSKLKTTDKRDQYICTEICTKKMTLDVAWESKAEIVQQNRT